MWVRVRRVARVIGRVVIMRRIQRISTVFGRVVVRVVVVVVIRGKGVRRQPRTVTPNRDKAVGRGSLRTMSETQRNPFNRSVSGLLIAGAFVLLVTLFFAFRTPPIETQSVKVITPPPPRRVHLTPPEVFETEVSFYATRCS